MRILNNTVKMSLIEQLFEILHYYVLQSLEDVCSRTDISNNSTSTQTDLPVIVQQVSVGSQARNSYRSKAVQVNLTSKLLVATAAAGTQCLIEDAIPTVDVGIQCILETETIKPVFTSTPLKNSTFESSMISTTLDDSNDPSYRPESDEDEDGSNIEDNNATETHKECKYIVFESCLLALFKICLMCSATTCATVSKVIGTCCIVVQKCDRCGFKRRWESQLFVGDFPVGNVVLATAIVCSGVCMRKILRLFEFVNCSMFSMSTLMSVQANYIQPAIQSVWSVEQKKFFSDLKSKGLSLIIGGDARADSPGHSAKYGSYTVMEMRLQKIIMVELVQCNEVGGSYHMEKEGLSRALINLANEGFTVEQLITDRHPQIIKWIATQYPKIKHLFDIWHVAKSVQKKLVAAGKLKDCELLIEWKQSFINHMYWCATSNVNDNGDVKLAKWLSLENHAMNEHEGHGALFPKCLHGPINDARKWISPHTKVALKLSGIINNKSLCKDVKRVSPVYQTYRLEAFHSLIIHFAPKSLAFSYMGMKCRLLLAALHFNENSSRGVKRNLDGSERHVVTFPKAKSGKYAVRQLCESSSYNYVNDILKTVIMMHESNNNVNSVAVVPPSICSAYLHPNKMQAIREHKSRFVKDAQFVNDNSSNDTVLYVTPTLHDSSSNDTVLYDVPVHDRSSDTVIYDFHTSYNV